MGCPLSLSVSHPSIAFHPKLEKEAVIPSYSQEFGFSSELLLPFGLNSNNRLSLYISRSKEEASIFIETSLDIFSQVILKITFPDGKSCVVHSLGERFIESFEVE